MKKEKVVFWISVIFCGILLWIIFGNQSEEVTVEEFVPKVDLYATFEPIDYEEYTYLLDDDPTLFHSDVRELQVQFNTWDFKSADGDVQFIEEYKLEQLIASTGKGREALIGWPYHRSIRRNDEREYISGSYRATFDTRVIGEDELLEVIAKYPLGYRIIDDQGQTHEMKTTLGEILTVEDASIVEVPRIEVSANLVPVSQTQWHMAKSEFDDESIEYDEVKRLEVRLRGYNLGYTQAREIIFLDENIEPPNHENIHWKANGKERNNPDQDDAFYYLDGLVYLDNASEKEIEEWFSNYAVSYRIVDRHGVEMSESILLDEVLVYGQEDGDEE